VLKYRLPDSLEDALTSCGSGIREETAVCWRIVSTCCCLDGSQPLSYSGGVVSPIQGDLTGFGVMIARRDPGSMVTVPARPYVVIPAALRRRCGLRAGDHVRYGPSGDLTAARPAFPGAASVRRAHQA
jgi:hypothetical protein